MSQYFESAEELAAAMAARSRTDALIYLNGWLERRNDTDELTTDDLVTALKLLAAELSGEAAESPDQRTLEDRLRSVSEDGAEG